MLLNSAAPVNYLALARLTKYQRSEGPVPELRDLEQRLIHVIKTENDRDSIHNLKVLYQLAAQRMSLRQPESDSNAYQQSISQQLEFLTHLEHQVPQARQGDVIFGR